MGTGAYKKKCREVERALDHNDQALVSSLARTAEIERMLRTSVECRKQTK